MKKMMSSMLIGLIAATATMSTMAAPAFEHKNLNPAGHFDQNDHRNQFAKKEHKGFFSKDKKHKALPDHKAPPMPPKHR